MPWVVADYWSLELDLHDPATFRDLSKAARRALLPPPPRPPGPPPPCPPPPPLPRARSHARAAAEAARRNSLWGR
jgi:hypothetical protein